MRPNSNISCILPFRFCRDYVCLESVRKPGMFLTTHELFIHIILMKETGRPEADPRFEWKSECTDSTYKSCYFQNVAGHSFAYVDGKFLSNGEWKSRKSMWRVFAPNPTERYRIVREVTTDSKPVKTTIKTQVGVTNSESRKIETSYSLEIGAAFKFFSASASFSQTWSHEMSRTFEQSTEISFELEMGAEETVKVKQSVGTYGPFTVNSGSFIIECVDKQGRECRRKPIMKEKLV